MISRQSGLELPGTESGECLRKSKGKGGKNKYREAGRRPTERPPRLKDDLRRGKGRWTEGRLVETGYPRLYFSIAAR